MTDRYDVVIVGGGVMGCAVAYFLASDPGFGGSVAVVERDPTYQRASSALSASSIRQQFSTPANIALSQFGLSFIRNAAEHLSVDGDPVDLGLREPGYLYLATGAGADICAGTTPSNSPAEPMSPFCRRRNWLPAFPGCRWRGSRSAPWACRVRGGSTATA